MPSVSAVQLSVRVDPARLPALKEPDDTRRRVGPIPSGVANPNAVAIRFLRVGTTLARGIAPASARIGTRQTYSPGALIRLRATSGKALARSRQEDAPIDDGAAGDTGTEIRTLSQADFPDDDLRRQQEDPTGRLRSRGMTVLGFIPVMGGIVAVVDFDPALAAAAGRALAPPRMRADGATPPRPVVSAATRTAALRTCPVLRAANLRVTQRLRREAALSRALTRNERTRARPLDAALEIDTRPRSASFTTRMLTRGLVRRWPASETFDEVPRTALIAVRLLRRRDYLRLPLNCVATPRLLAALVLPAGMPMRPRWRAPGSRVHWA